LTHPAQIVELAAKNRLPVMDLWPEFTEIGGLMAYSTNRTEMYRRSPAFVDRVLRLGLSIPPPLLQRADQAIG
jgi:hypothetical protein